MNRPQALGDLAAWLSRAARNPQADRAEDSKSTRAQGGRIGLHRHPPGMVKNLSVGKQEAVADYASIPAYLGADGSP